MCVRKEEYKGYVIKIELDDEPESPREWENFGTMVCSHREYVLGDKQTDEKSFWVALQNEIPEECEDFLHYYDRDGCEHVWIPTQAEIGKNLIWLPLYLYNHSGLSMSVAPFNDPWDSGRVGFIYMSVKDAKKEFMWKRMTQKRRKYVESMLEVEVKAYNKYLTGEVYGFIVEDETGDNIDSCWGYYMEPEEVIEEAKRSVDLEFS
jgi:hypothetical protein